MANKSWPLFSADDNNNHSAESLLWRDYHAVDKCDAIYLANMSVFANSWTDDDAFWPTVVTYSAAFVVGIAGNAFVIFAMVADRKVRNGTSTFLISLAFADILFLAMSVPYVLVAKYTGYWTGGRALCKIASFCELLSTEASALNLTAVSVERFVVIVHPLKSRSWCTTGKTKKVIAAVWLFAVLLTSPAIYVMGIEATIFYNDETHVITVVCSDASLSQDDRLLFAWYKLVIVFIVPSIVMVYCYAFVIYVLGMSTRNMANMTQMKRGSGEEYRQQMAGTGWTMCYFRSGHRHMINRSLSRDHGAEIRKARKQVIKMLLAIIVVFLGSYGPKLILNIMKRQQHLQYMLHTHVAYTIMLVIQSLPYLQSAANPIIYSLMSNNFRRSMRFTYRRYCIRKACRRHGRRRSSSEYDLDPRSINTYLRYSPPILTQNKQATSVFF